jgi:propionate CoA-transferase
MENLEVAMAVHNAGGLVIAQVESVSDSPAPPHQVMVPGIFVDVIVVATSRATHPHTMFVEYDPSYSGRARVPLAEHVKPCR